MIRLEREKGNGKPLKSQEDEDQRRRGEQSHFPANREKGYGKKENLEKRHDPDAGQLDGARDGPAGGGHDGGRHAPQRPDEQMGPVHFPAIRRIVHERPTDAPVVGIHQIARMGEPGVAVRFEKEAGLGHTLDRVGRNGRMVEGLRGPVRVPGEEDDMPREQEQAKQHPGDLCF